MTLANLASTGLAFRSSEDVLGELESACDANPDLATFEVLGESEEGRPIAGVTLGYGPHVVTLVAGAHADEPVGPETLRALVLEGLAMRDWGAEDGGLAELFERVTLRIVPHVNPDAEARNAGWIRQWDAADPAATLGAYLRGRRRELPGRDVEFGYPAMRVENALAHDFLFSAGVPVLHASLHGMGFSEGALLLIEKDWLHAPAVADLKTGFVEAATEAGLRLHDHDRKGDKGFRYGGPGFTSTPEGRAMRAHFLESGDAETAERFHLSSMEAAIAASRGQGGGIPLCIVTELPLFVLDAEDERQPGVPTTYLAFQDALPDVVERAAEGEDLSDVVEQFGVRCLDLDTQVAVHLRVLDLALTAST